MTAYVVDGVAYPCGNRPLPENTEHDGVSFPNVDCSSGAEVAHQLVTRAPSDPGW